MNYYEVWVRSHRYQNRSVLTYQSQVTLGAGQLVMVPLQSADVPAIVIRKVSRPNFRCKSITHVLDAPPLPPQSLQLFRWLQAYYPAPIGPTTQLFVPERLPQIEPSNTTQTTAPAVALNEEQSTAVDQVTGPGSYLLHGRTGSGKTRVYAALADRVIRQGKSVIIMTPEIGLAPQLADNLESLLRQKPVVFHSKLTAKQRNEAWMQVLTASGPQIVVGPRSALFLPIRALGLIVLDEAHEPAYKQEQQPYYFAPRVAAKLGELHDAAVIYGSATPPVTEYYLATERRRPILELSQLAAGTAQKVETMVVDLKDRSQFSAGTPHISQPLVKAVEQSLRRGEQSLLYLNLRGTARVILCQQCGWQALCPNCDLPLTYHADKHQLLCHTCGHREASLTTCPVCGNAEIVFKSAGTKSIIDEVQRLFPQAVVRRFDADNTKAERLDQNFRELVSGKIDIIVGTQLLAKGLDLPRLSTLGVITADSGLTIPDFSAQERTFQLLQQVIGRIGRGHTEHAIAVIQAYDPASEIIRAVLKDDWKGFYNKQLLERQQFNFPPFCHLMKLAVRRSSPNSAEKAAANYASQLTAQFGRTLQVDGPAPAFREKQAGKYEWQLVLRAKQRSILLQVIDNLPSGWTYDIDPINLL
jgi:primosomal protein N' (replication factor Y)